MSVFEVFEVPGSPVGVTSEAITERLVSSSEARAFFAEADVALPVLEEELAEEVSPFAAWVGVGARARSIARVLGGDVVMETFRNTEGDERHQLRYVGPEMEI